VPHAASSKPARQILNLIYSTFTVTCGKVQAVPTEVDLVKRLRLDALWV